MQANYHPSTGWIPPNHTLTLSPSAWSDPESRQESPASMKAMKNNVNTAAHSPYSEPPLVKTQQQQQHIYASPQQPHRPVYYPATSGLPQQQHSQQYSNNNGSNNNNFYSQQLASPHAVYDEASYGQQRTPYNDKKDNSMSLFSGMPSYSSWIEQQHHDPQLQQQLSPSGHNNNNMDHSHSSHYSMASPGQPQRSIWATAQAEGKSPSLGPPTVYQAAEEDPAIAGMSRLSLVGGNSQGQHPAQQQSLAPKAGGRNSGSSVGSNYTNLPGLVQASSESTASASVPTLSASWHTNSNNNNANNTNKEKDETEAANANILHSSLRSFLDDDGDDSYSASPNADRAVVIAGPPGFHNNNKGQQQQRPGNYKMGNANTRRNRNRNKLRQQKKVEQQHGGGGRNNNPRGGNNSNSYHYNNKTLKERNDHNNNLEGGTTLEPLFEKPPLNSTNNQGDDGHSSLKRAVAQQHQQERRGSAGGGKNNNNNHNGSSSEALRMLMSSAPTNLEGPSEHSTSLHQSVLDLESSFLHGSASSLRLTSPVCSPRTPGKQEPSILPQQLPAPTLPFDFSFSNYQDNSTNSEDDDDLILQHILASEHQQSNNQDSSNFDPSNSTEDLDDHSPTSLGKKREWLLRMNKKIQEVPVGELDPSAVPISAIMNAWAKTKSAQGASMVEMWLRRAQQEYSAGNHRIVPTTKMYTMAGMFVVDDDCVRESYIVISMLF